MSRTLIIAEPGGTHEGGLDLMHRLIDVAADCGADVFKSQWTSNAQAMCDRRHAPEYLADYFKLQYPIGWHGDLRAHAVGRGLQYACSVYVPGDPTLIAPFVDFIKISSFEASDAALFVEAMWALPAQSNLPMSAVETARVIVSNGMNDERMFAWTARRDGSVRYPRAVLHCVSSYPTPLAALNLSLCSGNGRRDGEPLFYGFSDHSHDVRVGAWAVCSGAAILETHFRLDDCDPANKDYAVAFTPVEFTTYIQNVRDAEAALGDGVKRIQPAEEPMLKYRVTA